jgi:hypothetical protein
LPTVKLFIGGKTFYQPEKARFWGIKATTPTQSSKFSLPLILGGQPLRKKQKNGCWGLLFAHLAEFSGCALVKLSPQRASL